MKERKRRGIVLLRESRLGESVSGGSGKFAVAVVVEHFLEVCASIRQAIEISIAFAQRKIGVGPAGKPRIIIEIFLIFRDCQIVKFASEKRVRIIELAAVRRFAFSRWWFGRIFRGRARRSCGWFLQRQRTRNRRLIYGSSPAHLGRPLSEGRARHRKQHCQPKKTGRAARSSHFAVAKATLVIPASVQMFKTPMILL